MCFVPIVSITPAIAISAKVDAHAFHSTYQQGLQEAAILQQQSVKQNTVKTRNTVARELMDWLQRMNRSMASAIPEDILVFFTQHWLPNHAGSPTLSGKLIAAPTSLAGAKSHLAKEFELQVELVIGTLQNKQAIPCTACRSET